jgi:hypothetical protein
MKCIYGGTLKLLLVGALLFIVACGRPDTSENGTGLQIYSGSNNWLAELNKLKNPNGVLPTGTAFSAAGITYDTWGTSYEFFAYDDNYCLILLSNSPVYFIRLETKDFQFHLKNELKQLRDLTTPTNKEINSITYLKKLGDYTVEVYFTPKEFKYVSSGVNQDRLGDANDTTAVDLWKLAEASGNAVFYTPSFDDQKIADDFYTQTNAGKTRLILADSSTIASPVNYNLKSYGLGFSFLTGQNLGITDNLLGTEDIRFVDQFKLTREFITLISAPVNNGASGLAQKHGIAVLIRGDITKIRDFISAQGVNLRETPTVAVNCPVSAGDIVINEVGTNCNSNSNNSYIEIYNKKNCGVSLSGWRIYRASSTKCAGILPASWSTTWSSSWTASITLSGSIPAQGYKVIGKNSYLAGTSCPTPDIIATSTNDISLSTNSCMALTNGGSTPTSVTDSNVIDFVGWGTSANFEGSVAPQMSAGNDQCISRSTDGSDTNTNGTDFVDQAAKPCSPGASNGSLNVMTASATTNTTTITVYFSAVPVTAQAQTGSNYCIALASASNCSVPAITISTAVLSGKVVTLTTGAQTSGTKYKLYVSGVTALVGSGALSKNTADFSGYGPIFGSVTPLDATTLDLNFDSVLDSATVNGFPGSFTFTNSLTASVAALQGSAPIANRRIRLTTGSHTAGTNYTVTVASSVTGSGNPVNSDFSSASFYGFTPFISVARDFGGILEQTTAGMDDVNAWTNVASGTLASDVSTVKQGTGSLTWSTLTTSCTGGREGRVNACYPVTPGGAYSASMFIKANTVTGGGTVGARMRIYWFKDSGCSTPASTANSLGPAQTNLTTGSAWTQHTSSVGYFTAPADAYYTQFHMHGCYSAPATSSDQLYFDQVYFGP